MLMKYLQLLHPEVLFLCGHSLCNYYTKGIVLTLVMLYYYKDIGDNVIQWLSCFLLIQAKCSEPKLTEKLQKVPYQVVMIQ